MENLKFIEKILIDGLEYPVYQYEGNIWDFDGCLKSNSDVVIKSYVEDNKGYHFKGQVCSLGDDVIDFIKKTLQPTKEDMLWDISMLLNGLETKNSIEVLRNFYLQNGKWDGIRFTFYNVGSGVDVAKLESMLGIEPEPKQAELIPAEQAISEAIADVRANGYEAFDYNFGSLYNAYGSDVAIQFRETCKKEGLI